MNWTRLYNKLRDKIFNFKIMSNTYFQAMILNIDILYICNLCSLFLSMYLYTLIEYWWFSLIRYIGKYFRLFKMELVAFFYWCSWNIVWLVIIMYSHNPQVLFCIWNSLQGLFLNVIILVIYNLMFVHIRETKVCFYI